jgi:ABC-type nickel/cobalt efflux system permease component RcnA
MFSFIAEKEKNLIVTGLSLGLIHVMAGPDHLSALAALAVGTSYKAFMLGFRWGIGHSTGLIVVAIIFILLKGDLDLRKLGRYCDLLVGLFMICLGGYGVVNAIRVYREKRQKRDCDTRYDNDDHEKNNSSTNLVELVSNVNANSSLQPLSPTSSTSAGYKQRLSNEESILLEQEHIHHDHEHDDDDDHHIIEECGNTCPFINMQDPTTQKLLSFSIGLLHGVAGPGGILGVLPALEMQQWTSSVLYLGSFIFASTLSMGTFAALYGESTRRLGASTESVELALSIFSSGMSIIVGVIWFVFSILGKLEKFFH